MKPIVRLILLTLFVLSGTSSLRSQNCIYPAGSQLYIQNINCSLKSELCIDIPFGDRMDYEVYVDGSLYTDPFTPCNYDTMYFYSVDRLLDHVTAFPVNDIVVDSVRINGQLYSFSFATIEDLADSLNLIDNTSTWIYNSDPVDPKFLEGNLSSTYDHFYFTDVLNTTSFEANFQSREIPNGLTIDITNGIHEVVINNLISGCRDTLSAESYCLSDNSIRDTLLVNSIDTICFELSDLRGAVTSIMNVCPGQSGIEAMIDVIPGTGCIEVTALDVGLDSACIVIIDDEGLRDTVFYSVQVIETLDSTDFLSDGLDFA